MYYSPGHNSIETFMSHQVTKDGYTFTVNLELQEVAMVGNNRGYYAIYKGSKTAPFRQ